jgi:pimeloyl-ACP methyl ester carboxylesterase
MREKALLLGQNRSLIGILTEPDPTVLNVHDLCVIFLNAGFTHRIGPNRIYVKLARSIAAQGIPCLRFDFSGIGDTPPRTDNLPFKEYTVQETREAIDQMQRSMHISRFIIVGLCSGAEVGFQATLHDYRIVGIISINGALLTNQEEQSLLDYTENRIRQRYYYKHLFRWASWRRFLLGQSNYQGIYRAIIEKTNRRRKLHSGHMSPSSYTQQCKTLLERQGSLLLIFSEGSRSLDLFQLTLQSHIGDLEHTGRLSVKIIENVDHNFTPLWSHGLLCDMVVQWLEILKETSR